MLGSGMYLFLMGQTGWEGSKNSGFSYTMHLKTDILQIVQILIFVSKVQSISEQAWHSETKLKT